MIPNPQRAPVWGKWGGDSFSATPDFLHRMAAFSQRQLDSWAPFSCVWMQHGGCSQNATRMPIGSRRFASSPGYYTTTGLYIFICPSSQWAKWILSVKSCFRKHCYFTSWPQIKRLTGDLLQNLTGRNISDYLIKTYPQILKKRSFLNSDKFFFSSYWTFFYSAKSAWFYLFICLFVI